MTGDIGPRNVTTSSGIKRKSSIRILIVGLCMCSNSSIDPLCVDSVLVNGQGQVWCPGAEAMKPYTIPGVVPERTAKGYAHAQH